MTAPNPDADGLVGAITLYAGETLPGPKYRWAHGTQTLSRTEFSLCFSRLGELWGAGDGSTTFNLPNLDKRVPAGVDSTGADAAFDGVGDTGGSAAATMPAHDHPAFASVTVQSGLGATIAAGSGTGPLVTGSAGGTGDNWPPYAAVLFIIKVS